MQLNKTSEMAMRIFAATERLMAEKGLHALSMQKIAREAGISAGSIYVYFKNKEELLELLARHLFEKYQREISKNLDFTASAFTLYRQMWWNLWNALLENPDTTLNMYQYKSLPTFYCVIQEYESSEGDAWYKFCEQAKRNNEIIELHSDLLWVLSMESAINLAFDEIHRKANNAQNDSCELSTALLEKVIERSWRAIAK